MLPRFVPRVLAATSSTFAWKVRTSTPSVAMGAAYVAGSVASTVLAGDSVTPPNATPSSVQPFTQRLPGTRVWRDPSGSVTLAPYIVVFFGIVVTTV